MKQPKIGRKSVRGQLGCGGGTVVVYHAAFTRPAAPDHAPLLPPLARAEHTFAHNWCRLWPRPPQPPFPTAFETLT